VFWANVNRDRITSDDISQWCDEYKQGKSEVSDIAKLRLLFFFGSVAALDVYLGACPRMEAPSQITKYLMRVTMWIKRLSNTRQLIACLIQVAVIALSVIGKLTDNELAKTIVIYVVGLYLLLWLLIHTVRDLPPVKRLTKEVHDEVAKSATERRISLVLNVGILLSLLYLEFHVLAALFLAAHIPKDGLYASFNHVDTASDL
jgi:hypothetical protein